MQRWQDGVERMETVQVAVSRSVPSQKVRQVVLSDEDEYLFYIKDSVAPDTTVDYVARGILGKPEFVIRSKSQEKLQEAMNLIKDLLEGVQDELEKLDREFAVVPKGKQHWADEDDEDFDVPGLAMPSSPSARPRTTSGGSQGSDRGVGGGGGWGVTRKSAPSASLLRQPAWEGPERQEPEGQEEEEADEDRENRPSRRYSEEDSARRGGKSGGRSPGGDRGDRDGKGKGGGRSDGVGRDFSDWRRSADSGPSPTNRRDRDGDRGDRRDRFEGGDRSERRPDKGKGEKGDRKGDRKGERNGEGKGDRKGDKHGDSKADAAGEAEDGWESQRNPRKRRDEREDRPRNDGGKKGGKSKGKGKRDGEKGDRREAKRDGEKRDKDEKEDEEDEDATPPAPRTFDRSSMKSTESGLSFAQLMRGFKTLEEAKAAEDEDVAAAVREKDDDAKREKVAQAAPVAEQPHRPAAQASAWESQRWKREEQETRNWSQGDRSRSWAAATAEEEAEEEEPAEAEEVPAPAKVQDEDEDEDEEEEPSTKRPAPVDNWDEDDEDAAAATTERDEEKAAPEDEKKPSSPKEENGKQEAPGEGGWSSIASRETRASGTSSPAGKGSWKGKSSGKGRGAAQPQPQPPRLSEAERQEVEEQARIRAEKAKKDLERQLEIQRKWKEECEAQANGASQSSTTEASKKKKKQNSARKSEEEGEEEMKKAPVQENEVSSLSPERREELKLSKKLREIEAIEQSAASGKQLDPPQREKLTKKSEVVAALEVLVRAREAREAEEAAAAAAAAEAAAAAAAEAAAAEAARLEEERKAAEARAEEERRQREIKEAEEAEARRKEEEERKAKEEKAKLERLEKERQLKEALKEQAKNGTPAALPDVVDPTKLSKRMKKNLAAARQAAEAELAAEAAEAPATLDDAEEEAAPEAKKEEEAPEPDEEEDEEEEEEATGKRKKPVQRPKAKVLPASGSAKKQKQRQVKKQQKAEEFIETESCNISRYCPTDCTLTSWTAWSNCSATCGFGTEKRTRKVKKPESNGGKKCQDALAQERPCMTPPDCPIDCQLSAWTSWSTCTRTCAVGSQFRRRQITDHAENGGAACSTETFEEKTCGVVACPGDCVLSSWTGWSNCSQPCGGGISSRNRSKYADQHDGGKVCPAMNETRSCNSHKCPDDCVVTQWSTWSVCSKTCGAGKSVRHRTILKQSEPGGKSSGPLVSERECWPQKCPVDCHVHAWGEWSTCSTSCGLGVTVRVRINTSPKNGGAACPKEHIQHKKCRGPPCPRDCLMDSWSGSTACSLSCGGGNQERSRIVLAPPKYGGAECPKNLRQVRNCSEHPCPEDCVVGNWTEEECSVTCGVGAAIRHRPILTNSSHGGIVCPPRSESFQCIKDPCPTDCVLSKWTDWSKCSKLCGGGLKERHRVVVAEKELHGKCTEKLRHSEKCNTATCPADCIVGPWHDWGACSVLCAGGQQSRNRTVKIQPGHLGGCDPKTENRSCNTQVCCQYSDWSEWLSCSKTCGHGKQMRTRTISLSSDDCPEKPFLEQSESCMIKKCGLQPHNPTQNTIGEAQNGGPHLDANAPEQQNQNSSTRTISPIERQRYRQGPKIPEDDNDKANRKSEGSWLWNFR